MQVVISTGKSDWEREVTEARGSLAAHLNDLSVSGRKASHSNGPKTPGVFNSDSATRLSILNGSHHTTSDDASKQTVLVFPDYKIVTEIDSTKKGAETLANGYLDSELSKAGSDQPQIGTKSWIIPYQAVILLCQDRVFFKHAVSSPHRYVSYLRLSQAEGQQMWYCCTSAQTMYVALPLLIYSFLRSC